MLQRISGGWTGSVEGERSGDRSEAPCDGQGEEAGFRATRPLVALAPTGGRCACPQAEWCAASGAIRPVQDADAQLTAVASDAGMSTVEYAVGTVVAAAFAAVLYKIVTGDSVIAGLTNLINTALNTSF